MVLNNSSWTGNINLDTILYMNHTVTNISYCILDGNNVTSEVIHIPKAHAHVVNSNLSNNYSPQGNMLWFGPNVSSVAVAPVSLGVKCLVTVKDSNLPVSIHSR